MSIMNNDSFLTITTQSDNNGIMFKNYHFGLRRTNENGTKICFCTHQLCNATVTTRECSIIKTSYIKSDGNHEYEHEPKISLNVYKCIISVKRQIEEELIAPISLLYDQQVKKFRRKNASVAEIPVFTSVKSSLYEYRSFKQPPVLKT